MHDILHIANVIVLHFIQVIYTGFIYLNANKFIFLRSVLLVQCSIKINVTHFDMLSSNAITFRHFEKCPNHIFAQQYFVYPYKEIMMLFSMVRINWTYASYFCYEFLMMIVSSPLRKVSEGENAL